MIGLTDGEVETVVKAMHKLEDQHVSHPDGIDNYIMARQARILRKLEHGDPIYNQFWPPLSPFAMQTTDGQHWTIHMFTLPEIILTGFAVSRDRYCRWEDQDMDELRGRAYCLDANRRAIALFRKIERGTNAGHGFPH